MAINESLIATLVRRDFWIKWLESQLCMSWISIGLGEHYEEPTAYLGRARIRIHIDPGCQWTGDPTGTRRLKAEKEAKAQEPITPPSSSLAEEEDLDKPVTPDGPKKSVEALEKKKETEEEQHNKKTKKSTERGEGWKGNYTKTELGNSRTWEGLTKLQFPPPQLPRVTTGDVPAATHKKTQEKAGC